MSAIKKEVVFGVVAFLFISGLSAVNVASENTHTLIGGETLTFSYQFDAPRIESTVIDDIIYDRVIIEDLPNSYALRCPRLPVKPLKILLPYGQEVNQIQITVSEKFSIGADFNIEVGQNIAPFSSQDIQLGTSPRINHDDTSPLFSEIGVQFFRGYSILFLNLHPVCYDEETGELFYYEFFKIEITTTPLSDIPRIRGLSDDKNQVSIIVENPETLKSYPDHSLPSNLDVVQYVIITNEALAGASGDFTFNDLVQSKIDKGLSAGIYLTDEIVENSGYWVNGTWGDNNPTNPFWQYEITTNYSRFNDTAAKIRNFIRYAYMELGAEYVLLGGDADVSVPEDNIIPARGLYATEEGLPLNHGLDFEEDDIPSDIYYACLDGNFNYDMDIHFGENETQNDLAFIEEADLLAEVYVGRACVDAEDEVSNFVMKTLSYENTEDNDAYLAKALMVGEHLGFPGISEWGGNYKDLIIPLIPDEFNVETLYERDGSWNKYDLMDILNNAPPHLINHLGHGNHNYALKMYNSDILTLTNTKYFLIYSQTCLAGSFDNWRPGGGHVDQDCAAEHFTVETPNGAFAVIMNSRYGLGSENTLYSPSQIVDESFFTALFTEDIRQIGRANHYAKEDHVWHINENGIRWVYYETNLFGDPEIYIKDPNGSEISLSLEFLHPENNNTIYVLNKKLATLSFLQHPIILGKFTILVEAISDPEGLIASVEFLLDDESPIYDYQPPYEYQMNTTLFGRHSITAIAHGVHGGSINASIKLFSLILGF